MACNEETLNTKLISSSLKEHALKYHCVLKDLDFTLLGLQSYFKTCKLETFVKFHDNYKKEYANSEILINDNARFTQIFKIKIHLKQNKDFDLVYRLELGEFCTYPILVISPNSTLPTHTLDEKQMLKLLYNECNKIKAKHSFLVNLFSSCLIADLKSFISKIYKNGFIKEESILLFEGIDPVVSQASEVVSHYKKDKQKVAEVEADQLIVTYIKPIYGDTGLNAKGQSISHGSANNHAKIEYDIDEESITTKESSTQIEYYSRQRGFVSTLNNLLCIAHDIVLEDIKKGDGSITHKEENQVAIHISQTDVTKDGVGEGVELVSESVHITGHMGAKSSIETKECLIDGATHHDSFVTARVAKINRHKGTLRCHKAEINSLEGGTVYATHVKVNSALGGHIYAEHVTIKTLKHNLKVFASKSITIEKVLGEDNHFIIDYRKLPVLQSKLIFLNEELDELQWKLEDCKKHSPQKCDLILKDIKEKSTEINAIKLSHYDAVITIMAPVNGLNIIEFAITEKQQSLIYRTKEARNFEPFYLRRSNGHIILEPVNLQIEE